MINIVNGNILDSNENIIVHQVNCQGVMGAGLAKQIRNAWPQVFLEYKSLCNTANGNTESLLGEVQYVSVPSLKIKFIANLFGQNRYGRGTKQTDYSAFSKAFRSIMEAASFSNLTVAVSYGIGCGLAGGEWKTIYSIMEELAEKNNVNVTIYKLA